MNAIRKKYYWLAIHTITSKWIQSAPLSRSNYDSSPSLEKSHDRIEGAMIVYGLACSIINT